MIPSRPNHNLSRRYNVAFQMMHAVYRIASSTDSSREFLLGVGRIFQNALGLSSVTVILMYPDSSRFIKVTGGIKRNFTFKKGAEEILTKQEKAVLENNRPSGPTGYTIGLPLIFINNVGAVILKRGKKDEPFDDFDNRLIGVVCEEMAIITKNLQLYEEQHKTVLATIKAFTECLNFHTPTSQIDMQFFSRVIREMARKLDLTQGQVQALEYAASLHDAGKFQISQNLLQKVQPLTHEEREIIKKHPKKGAELFKDLDVLKPVVPIILYHHEKYDGSGYPKGLKKNQIPIEARILAILDAFDAMFFGRSYRSRISLEEALEEIKAHAGSQFDPEIVAVFVSVVSRPVLRNYLKKRVVKV
jgi:hypothetical protein